MEIFMQWLDDADDVVFALVQTVERLRWPSLEIAFAAASSLVIVRAADDPRGWVPALLWVTIAALALWTMALMIRVAPRAPDRQASPSATRSA